MKTSHKHKKWYLRWWALLAAVVIFVLMGLMLALPYVIQVDRYRPQIEALLNQHISGQVKLGKFSLRLWATASVRVDGVEVRDRKKKLLLKTNQVQLRLPWGSVFSGKPHVFLMVKKPKIWLKRSKKGVWNVSTLLLKHPKKTLVPKVKKHILSHKKKFQLELPLWILRSSMGVRVLKAKVFFQDRVQGIQTQIQNISVKFPQLSLKKPLKGTISLKMDLSVAQGGHLSGMVYTKVFLKPVFQKKTLKKVHGKVFFDLSSLKIQHALFQKPKGTKLFLNVPFGFSPPVFKISHGLFHFGGQEALFSFKTHQNKKGIWSSFEGGMDSKNWSFSKLASFLPSLKRTSIGGNFKFQGRFQSRKKRLTYQGSVEVPSLLFQLPMMKTPLKGKGKIFFKTLELSKMFFYFQAPGNHWTWYAKGRWSVRAPQMEFQWLAKKVDFEKLLGWTKRFLDRVSAQASTQKKSVKKQVGRKTHLLSLDAKVHQWFQKYPILKKLRFKWKIKLDQVNVFGLSFKNWLLQSELFKGKISWNPFLTELWGSHIQTFGWLNLLNRLPSYHFSLKLKQFPLQKAVAYQLPIFKHTVTGIAFSDLLFEGRSLDRKKMIPFLKGKGQFHVLNPKIRFVDASKLLWDGVLKSISKLKNKIPKVKEKVQSKMARVRSEYKKLDLAFSLKKGIFQTTRFEVLSKKKKGFDMRGNLKVQLPSYQLDSKLWIMDPWNLTHLKEVNVTLSGRAVSQVLVLPGKPFQVPVVLKCTVFAPCPKYGETVSFLGKVVTQRITREAKNEVRKAVKKEVKKGVKGLLKKFKKWF